MILLVLLVAQCFCDTQMTGPPSETSDDAPSIATCPAGSVVVDCEIERGKVDQWVDGIKLGAKGRVFIYQLFCKL